MQNWDCQQMTALHVPLINDLTPKYWYLCSVQQPLLPSTQKSIVHAERKNHNMSSST